MMATAEDEPAAVWRMRALAYEQALREVQELMTSGQYTVSQTWEKVAFIVHAALDKPG